MTLPLKESRLEPVNGAYDMTQYSAVRLPAATTIGGLTPTQLFNLQWFNIVFYGAVAGQDSTAAIAAAYAAAVANGGGIVYVPANALPYYYSLTNVLPFGSALYDTQGSFVARNVTFRGDGPGSKLEQAGSGAADFSFYYGTNVGDITFEDLQFVGNNVPFDTGTTNPLAIHCETSSFIRVYRCVFTKSQGFGSILLNQSQNLWVEDNVFDTAGDARVTAKFMPMLNFGASGLSYRASVRGNKFYLAHWHAIWLQAEDSEVIGNSFYQCGESRVINGGGNSGAGNVIANNTDVNGWQSNVSGQFIESFSDNMTATGNKVFNAGQTYDPLATGNGNCLGIFSGGGNATITGNTIVGCKAGGISIDSTTGGGFPPLSGKNITVANNVVQGNDTADIGNGGILATGDGTAFSNLAIVDNAVSGNGVFDLNINNAYDPATTQVRGNTCWGDSIGSIPTSLGGNTALDLLTQFTVPAGSWSTLGGARVTMAGQLNTTAGGGTCALVALYGGSARIVIGGSWVLNDTVTYSLNGHDTVYTSPGTQSAAATAAGLAAAITADGTSGPLVFAVASALGSAQIVTITAKTAAYALIARISQGIAKSSAGGTATQNGTVFLDVVANYTSAANINLPFRLEALFQNQNIFSPQYNACIFVGTALVYQFSIGALMDTTIAQNLKFYGQLSAATDSTLSMQARYERL